MVVTLHPSLPETATHKDYSRFHFDTTHVPDKRIVGLLACQRDPLLSSLRTKVHAAREASIATPPPPKGKANQKKKVSNPTSAVEVAKEDKGTLWEIELLDTVIFPEGGGQPSDTGVIHLFNPNGQVQHTFPIEMCLRRKLDSVHLIRIPSGVEVEGGWEGREVEVAADWDRRLDQMGIHTSQHLLSAIVDTTLSLPTLSWSMHPYPSLEPPYVELSRALTLDEAIVIEDLCQQAINSNKKIWVDFSLQGGETKGAEGGAERESRGLPKDYDGGVIRHINIQDTDRNACCGTQTPSLSHLSLIHVIPPTPTTSSKPTPTKLYFLSGPRAVRALQQASRTLSSAARTVGYGRADIVERLERSEALKRETADGLKGLRNEIARLIAEKAIEQGRANNAVALIEREEKGTHDFEWLGLVASAYQEAFAAVPAVEGGKSLSPIIILTSSLPASPIPTQTLLLVMSPNNDRAKSAIEKIKSGLEGRVKGGGAKGRYMGKIDGKWGKAEKSTVAFAIEQLRQDRA